MFKKSFNLTKILFLILLCAVTFLGATGLHNYRVHAKSVSQELLLGGLGTQDDPYLITSSDELASMVSMMGNAANRSKAYKLTADCELTIKTYNGSIAGRTQQKFAGYFDGNNHTVTLKYEGSSSINNTVVSLFGYANGATIENVTVNCLGIGITTTGNVMFGGIVANASLTTIKNCKVTGSTTVTSNGETVEIGGIVGTAQNINIEDCNSELDITFTSQPTLADKFHHIGGVIGYISSPVQTTDGQHDSIIKRTSYNATNGIVVKKGNSTVVSILSGGIVGCSTGAGLHIVQCYNTSRFKSESNYTYKIQYGGIVGSSEGSSKTLAGRNVLIENCFFSGGINLTAPQTTVEIIGGLVGVAKNTKIVNSHAYINAFSKISGISQSGIIIGASSGEGRTGTNEFQNIYGYTFSDDLTELSASETGVAGLTKLTVAQFKDKNNFNDWDFYGVWIITDEDNAISNGNFPILRGVGNIAFEQEYRIVFHFDEQDSVAAVTSDAYVFGETVQIPTQLEGFEIEGSILTGWSVTANSNTVNYACGSSLTVNGAPFDSVTGLLNLYAVFEVNKYEIIASINKEAITNQNLSITYDEDLVVVDGRYYGYYLSEYTLVYPEAPSGYVFKFWEYDSDVIDNVVEDSDNRSITFRVLASAVNITAVYSEFYTITISSENEDYGKVSFDNTTFVNQDSITVEENSTISFYQQANTAQGYKFVRWKKQDGTDYSGATLNLRVTTNLVLIAVFDIQKFDISISFSSTTMEAGSATVNLSRQTDHGTQVENVTSTSTKEYVWGTNIGVGFQLGDGSILNSVKLTKYIGKTTDVDFEIVFSLESDEENYVFDGYNIVGINSNFLIELVVDSEQYTVTIITDTRNGDTSIAKFSDNSTESVFSYAMIETGTVSIFAEASESSNFVNWTLSNGNCVLTSLTDSNPTISSLTGDVVITAHFTVKVFSITINIDNHGFVYDSLEEDRVAIANGSSVVVEYGETPTLYFVPIDHYELESIILTDSENTSIDITYVSVGVLRESYQFDQVVENFIITITFTVEQFTITLTDESNISIDNVKITRTGTGSSYILQNYAITLDYGTLITVSIQEHLYSVGYGFSKFKVKYGDASFTDVSDLEFTFTLENDTTIEVVTKILIKGIVSTNGSVQVKMTNPAYIINPDSNDQFIVGEQLWAEFGNVVYITAVPNTGYQFKEWDQDDYKDENGTFTLLVEQYTVLSAQFESKRITLILTRVGSGAVRQNPDTIKDPEKEEYYVIGSYVEFTIQEHPGVLFERFTIVQGADERELGNIGDTTFSHTFTAEDAEIGTIRFKAYFEIRWISVDVTINFIDGGAADGGNARYLKYIANEKKIVEQINVKETVDKVNNTYTCELQMNYGDNILITSTDPNKITFNNVNDDFQIIYFFPDDKRFCLEDVVWVDTYSLEEISIIDQVGQNGQGWHQGQITYNSELIATFRAIYWSDTLSRYQDGLYFNYSWQGTGTEAMPITIETAEQLAAIHFAIENHLVNRRGVEYRTLHYKVMRDIDLSSKFWKPIGMEEDETKHFTGVFNFNYCNIKGIELLNYDGKTYYDGLFGSDEGTVLTPFKVDWVVVGIIGGAILLIIVLIIIDHIKKKMKNKKHIILPTRQYPPSGYKI